MSSRQYNAEGWTLVKRPIQITCRVTVGTGGAVTLQKWQYPTTLASKAVGSYAAAPTSGGPSNSYFIGNGEGVRSVTRVQAGIWTFVLSDAYQRMTQVSSVMTFGSNGGSAAPIWNLINSTSSPVAPTNVATNNGFNNGGTISVLFQASQGGGAVDPGNNETWDFQFFFADSTVI